MAIELPISFSGIVRPGVQRGRQLGFPTANIEVAVEVAGQLPRGVFSTRVRWEGGYPYWAVTNIGTRPTFEPGALSIEAHLLDFSGDLYGLTLEVELLRQLRGEKRFATVTELVAQIGRDIAETRKLFNNVDIANAMEVKIGA